MKERSNKTDLMINHLLGQIAALSKERAELLSEIHLINLEKEFTASELKDIKIKLEETTQAKNVLERKNKLEKINNKNEGGS